MYNDRTKIQKKSEIFFLKDELLGKNQKKCINILENVQ